MKVVISSKNPVKVDSAEYGFKTYFSSEHPVFESVSVPSGISDQPMTEEETLLGTKNRVENAIAEIPNADFYVGIEGGIEERNGQMEAFAWVYIQSKDGKVGMGRTGTFFLPEKLAKLLRGGMELGEADDLVFKQTNSKQGRGTVGTLTRDVIQRTEYYQPAVIFALIPFINPELY